MLKFADLYIFCPVREYTWNIINTKWLLGEYSFFHSAKILLNAYCIPEMVPGAEDTAI